ncbi:ribosomal-protein-alanine N-acetyltransferase [Haladaptatus litoreus]|uniref:Ribosomal-protein-alanine N-acetyltransferase n=1 Tax=Haladaptatus litoreus TaxID=553468 RepID=A0A1N7C4W3_9EURY|nr:GNAT family protein [Haladaptatus litoreus]SIR58629.1 ribosomal-protein-alanine N-acetyltransferase [Haladaptatus litoreus]
MEYELSQLAADDVDAIVSWHYDPPYDFYDMESDPEDLALFTNPENWDDKYAVFDSAGERVGFFSFDVGDDGDILEIGLGMHPASTGKGRGKAFVEAGMEFAAETYDPEIYSLAVATFNERAISVYEDIGFERQETFMQKTNGGEYEFLRMTLSRPL